MVTVTIRPLSASIMIEPLRHHFDVQNTMTRMGAYCDPTVFVYVYLEAVRSRPHFLENE